MDMSEEPATQQPENVNSNATWTSTECSRRQSSRPKECNVCGLPGAGNRRGMQICRPCDSFFIRTIALQLRYHCTSNNQCDISKERRSSCRKCRFDKCVRLGRGKELESSDSNPKDLTVNIPKAKEDALENYIFRNASESSSTDSYQEVVSIDTGCNIPGTPSTSAAINDENDTLLNCRGAVNDLAIRIIENLRESVEKPTSKVRLTFLQRAELAFDEYHESLPKPHLLQHETGEKANPGDIVSKYVDYFPQQIMAIASFLAQIDEFHHLSMDQKWLLFRGSWHSVMLVERFVAGFLKHKEEVSDKVILPDGSIHTLQDVMDGFSCTFQTSKHDIHEFFGPYIQQVQSNFVLPAIKMKATLTEFVFCLMHKIWDVKDLVGITSETSELSNRIHTQLADEMSNYYQYVEGISNYANRLTTLVNVATGLKKIDKQRHEDHMTSAIFDIIEAEFFAPDLAAPIKNLSIS